MKKLISIILIATLLISLTIPVNASEAKQENQSKITITDALEILKSLADMKSIYDNSDINPTIKDALEILKYLAGMTDRPALPFERKSDKSNKDKNKDWSKDKDKCKECSMIAKKCVCEEVVPPVESCECGCCEECGACGTCEICDPSCRDCGEIDCVCIDFKVINYEIIPTNNSFIHGIQVHTADSLNELYSIAKDNELCRTPSLCINPLDCLDCFESPIVDESLFETKVAIVVYISSNYIKSSPRAIVSSLIKKEKTLTANIEYAPPCVLFSQTATWRIILMVDRADIIEGIDMRIGFNAKTISLCDYNSEKCYGYPICDENAVNNWFYNWLESKKLY